MGARTMETCRSLKWLIHSQAWVRHSYGSDLKSNTGRHYLFSLHPGVRSCGNHSHLFIGLQKVQKVQFSSISPLKCDIRQHLSLATPVLTQCINEWNCYEGYKCTSKYELPTYHVWSSLGLNFQVKTNFEYPIEHCSLRRPTSHLVYVSIIGYLLSKEGQKFFLSTLLTYLDN